MLCVVMLSSIVLSVVMLSVAFHLLLCWMSLCWVSWRLGSAPFHTKIMIFNKTLPRRSTVLSLPLQLVFPANGGFQLLFNLGNILALSGFILNWMRNKSKGKSLILDWLIVPIRGKLFYPPGTRGNCGIKRNKLLCLLLRRHNTKHNNIQNKGLILWDWPRSIREGPWPSN